MKELEIIKNATISGDSKEAQVYRELKSIIEEKTDTNRHPEELSDEKIDMTDAIKRYGYTVEEYEKKFGSVMRSEIDVVKHLASMLSKSSDNNEEEDDVDDDMLELIELESETMKMRLRLI